MDTLRMEIAKKQAAQCRAIANARRLVILWNLSEGELPVNEIAARVGSSLQNVSQHLNLLKRAGVVTSRREGQTIYYQMADLEFLKHCPALWRATETSK